MNIPDIINGCFEAGAAVAVALNCFDIYRKKAVAGATLTAGLFFWAWGAWNIYYYAHLSQLFSWICGFAVLTANTTFVYLVFRYRTLPWLCQPVSVRDVQEAIERSTPEEILQAMREAQENVVRIQAIPDSELDEVFTAADRRKYKSMVGSIKVVESYDELQRSRAHKPERFARIEGIDIPVAFFKARP